MKIKKKLLITYLLAIIIPVGVTILLLFIGQVYINHQSRFDEIEDTDIIITHTIQSIEDNINNIDDYDLFYEKVFEPLKGENNEIIIVNTEGNLLFHSENKQGTINQEYYEIISTQSYSMNYEGKDDETIIVIAPLIKEDQIIGTMELSLDRFQFNMSLINELIRFLIIILLVGVLVLVLLITLFTNNVSKGVIKPLQSLSDAARKIANGELDHPITYHKKDEFGEFSEVFNMMRLKLKTSLEKEQELEESRKMLISSISHDLRTPITSIKGYVEAIIEGKVESQEKMESYLTVIRDKTTKLDRLIDDLFQFSQLEHGNLKLHKEKINTHDLIENIASSYMLELTQKGIAFNIIEPIPSVFIYIDYHAITRVFDNIIQNAKKYMNEKGCIELKCISHKKTVEFMIKDNGQGIKKEDLPHIFNRFYRGEKSRSRQYGGTGLGLAICKQMIEAHDGKIWVESISQEGSTFHFEIPLVHD